LVAAHQADVRGPTVGRGPQVENRCSSRCIRHRVTNKVHYFLIWVYLHSWSLLCPHLWTPPSRN